MKRQVFIIALIGIFPNAYSQSTVIWSKNMDTGISGYFTDQPTVVAHGDTITVTGRKNTPDGQRLLIVRYDLNGDTISTMTYGNDSMSNNRVADYKFDSLGHVYLLHKVQLGFYKSKIILQKYSLDGTLLWADQIQSPADTSYSPQFLGLANDTAFYMTAYKEYDYPGPGDDVINTHTIPHLYAYNSNGDRLWLRAFNPETELSWLGDDIFTHDGTAFLFTGGGLVKVDLNNTYTINTNTGILGVPTNVQLAPDNNLLLTSSMKYRIYKVDLNGNVLWTEYYGTNLPSNVSADEIRAMTQDVDGNIYITGRHCGTGYGTPDYSNADMLTIKYDSTGGLIWENRYVYGGNNADIANCITLQNGSVYVGGESQRLGIATDYDYLALKIDPASGTTNGIYRFNGIENGDDAISSLSVLESGSVALTGLSSMAPSYGWTTQFLADLVLSVPNVASYNSVSIYPNPISEDGLMSIKGSGYFGYSIATTIGQIVQQGMLGQNDLNTIRMEDLKPGIYIIQLKAEAQTFSGKLVVE